MKRTATILRGNPTVIPIAQMALIHQGLNGVLDWVRSHRPECVPDEVDDAQPWKSLFPHNLRDGKTGRPLTDNELLVEFAGRKCYDSFGLKAGRKENSEYIAHTQAMDPPHASIMYHAKMSFFVAGVSRRVSHEFIRNYVGADRSEEGAPSQESTRFTHHYGFFIEPPRYAAEYPEDAALSQHFEQSMQRAYDSYLRAVDLDVTEYERQHGKPPTSMDRKRIYEAASSLLPHQSETSFVWTTNPAAILKFMKERDSDAADMEMRRFARTWRKICEEWWPNLIMPWAT